MIHRWYYKLRGGHVHVRVFAGNVDGALGKCGDLVYRDHEFTALATSLQQGAGIQLLPEDVESVGILPADVAFRAGVDEANTRG